MTLLLSALLAQALAALGGLAADAFAQKGDLSNPYFPPRVFGGNVVRLRARV